MNKNKFIVGLGEALWDMLPTGKKLGGAPANFAYHVSQQGLKGIAVSAVGSDALGYGIIDALKENNLDFYMQSVAYPTGVVNVELIDGKPDYHIVEDVAWDNIEFTPHMEYIARNACAVCFGSLAQRSPKSRHTVRRFIETMGVGVGIYRVFDINLRQHFYSRDVIEESLRLSNVFKINDDEIKIITPMFELTEGDYEASCRKLIAMFDLDIVILTCGEKGSFIFTNDGETSFQSTPKVDAIDTVGAGDSFTATFICGLINGKGIVAAHKAATEVAAYVCTCHGAMPEYKK